MEVESRMFHFRLNRLLAYKLTLEEQAKRELALRRHTYEQESRKLFSLQQESARLDRFMSAKASGEVDLSILSITCEYSSLLNQRLEKQHELQSASARRVEEQKVEVKKSWQQRRMLEMLREKAWAEFVAAEQKQVYNLHDELALQAHTRKS